VFETSSFSRNYGGVALLLNCPIAFETALEINRAREEKLAAFGPPERNLTSRIGLEVLKLTKEV
jgi:hypothetical protein